MPKVVDLTGKKYNSLTVISPVLKTSVGSNTMWLCECDCGSEIVVSRVQLKKGYVKDCGCKKEENNKFWKYFVPDKNIVIQIIKPGLVRPWRIGYVSGSELNVFEDLNTEYFSTREKAQKFLDDFADKCGYRIYFEEGELF